MPGNRSTLYRTISGASLLLVMVLVVVAVVGLGLGIVS